MTNLRQRTARSNSLLQQCIQEFLRGPVNWLSSLLTIMAIVFPLLGVAGLTVPYSVTFDVSAISASGAASRFLILVLLSLALGWTLASCIGLFSKLPEVWRKPLAVLTGLIWGYIVVSFCQWLFPPGEPGRLALQLALWFTVFTAVSSAITILGARFHFLKPAPSLVEERALLLLTVPFSILTFFAIFLWVR